MKTHNWFFLPDISGLGQHINIVVDRLQIVFSILPLSTLNMIPNNPLFIMYHLPVRFLHPYWNPHPSSLAQAHLLPRPFGSCIAIPNGLGLKKKFRLSTEMDITDSDRENSRKSKTSNKFRACRGNSSGRGMTAHFLDQPSYTLYNSNQTTQGQM